MAQTVINKAAAVSGALGNTGFPKSIHNPGMQTGGILIPKGTYIPNASLGSGAAALTWLKSQVYEGRAARIFVIGRWENVERKGTDRTTETFNSGSIRTIRRGTIGYQFTVVNGGKWYAQSLFAFDQCADAYDLLVIDAKDNLIGVKRKDGSGNDVLGGRSLTDFYVGDWMDEDGSTGNKFLVDIQYTDSNEINRDYGYIAIGTSILTALTGLLSVQLADAGSATADVLKVAASTDYGETNLYDYYAALLNQGSAWEVLDPAANNAVVTVTGVAMDPVNKAWNITLATGVGTNNPGTGEPVVVRLKTPKQLATLSGSDTPVFGIEGANELTVDVP